MSQQDPKYDFEFGRVINTERNEPIPLDEPVMVFRARDVYARQLIRHYLNLIAAGPHDHVAAVLERHRAFNQFALDHPERIKEPDTAPRAPKLARDIMSEPFDP